MRQSAAVAKIALAVLGGWLAVMPSAVLTIALRLHEFDPSGLPTQYSQVLAVGWLTLMSGLIGFGHLGDRLEHRGHSRIRLVRLALPVLVVASGLMALAGTATQLGLAWTLMQVPASAIVTSALALSGSTITASRRGLLSGLIGAASIIALLVGSLVVRATQDILSTAFVATALIGATLALPLAIRPPERAVDPVVVDRRQGGTTRVGWGAAWGVFTVASVMLSWATSTGNGYLVMFLDYVARTPATELAQASTRVVSLATLAAITASVIAGASLRGRRSAALLWSGSAVAVAGALIGLFAFPTPTGILISAVCFGIGFGMANGVELGLLLFLRHSPGRLGRDLGIFNAMTSLPYVLVPAMATAWLASDVASGLHGMFTLAWGLALLGAALTAGVAFSARRRAA